jgi:hypothetical protein
MPLSEAGLQAARTGTFANAAQNTAASPIRKKQERSHPKISARIFMYVPPEYLASHIQLEPAIVVRE